VIVDIKQVQAQIAAFVAEREWDKFHNPKNLSMALAGEAGELLEHFQWLTEAESAALAADKKRAVGHEIADIVVYALRLCDKLGIDLEAAIQEKMKLNAAKYPPELNKGTIRKPAA
jgi:dCTP diphosphatase